MEQAAVLLADTALNFTPVIGDIKGFAEAKRSGDYIFAGIGLLPLAGDAVKELRTARKAYEAAKVSGDVRGMKQALQDSSDVVRASELGGSVVRRQADEYSGKVTAEFVEVVKREGRSGKQARLREMMNDPKASSADRGWLKNDTRHIKSGNKSGLRAPRNDRKSPGRKASDKGYELAHPHNKPASQGNGYEGSKLKNHADHKVETKLHKHRY